MGLDTRNIRKSLFENIKRTVIAASPDIDVCLPHMVTSTGLIGDFSGALKKLFPGVASVQISGAGNSVVIPTNEKYTITFRASFQTKPTSPVVNVFVKATPKKFAQVLMAEAASLFILRKVSRGTVIIAGPPQVLYESPVITGVINSYLISEWTQLAQYTGAMGRQLAQFHTAGEAAAEGKYGFHCDTYMRKFKLTNTLVSQGKPWSQWFISNRLQPVLTRLRAVASRSFRQLFPDSFEGIPEADIQAQFCQTAAAILQPHDASARSTVLHGDLWRGNLANCGGRLCLFDPATYFGERELDLATEDVMSGRGDGFLTSYNEVSPLDPGWENRFKVYFVFYLSVQAIHEGISSVGKKMKEIIAEIIECGKSE